MLSFKEHISIPKDTASRDDLDFEFLRQQGISYIEKLAGSLWTDFNSHDPGITILEVLSYAITDLGSRLNLPMADLLTVNDTGFDNQFHEAHEILSTRPVTHLDYRKLFIDIPGVRNAWLQRYEKNVFANCKDRLLNYDSFLEKEGFDHLKATDEKQFYLNGLYTILLDIEEDTDLENLKKQVRARYHENRNLCEDLIKIEEVGQHPVKVCAEIELDPDADEDAVKARVELAIQDYFTPHIIPKTLAELLESGKSPLHLFNGPQLQNGFLDDDEVQSASLKTQVRQSDLINLLLAVTGVSGIRNISMGACNDQTPDGSNWVFCIDPGKKPVLCDKSSFSFYKGFIPLNIDETRVDFFKKEILTAREANLESISNSPKTLSLPNGQHKNLGETTSIQNEFPEVYGIGPYGLKPTATPAERAKAKQLKAYLLFFDQILANYFKHLEQVSTLFSVSGKAQSHYFAQAIRDLKDRDMLFKGYDLFQQLAVLLSLSRKEIMGEVTTAITELKTSGNGSVTPTKLTNALATRLGISDTAVKGQIKLLLEQDDAILVLEESINPYDDENLTAHFYPGFETRNLKKRNEILDHLLARFAENFGDYAFLMRKIYGEFAEEAIISTKEGLLQHYAESGSGRALSFNYFNQKPENLWDTPNISALLKRLYLLLGITDINRRNLSEDYIEIYEEQDDDDQLEYRWRIKDGSKTILSSATKHYKNLEQLHQELVLVKRYAQDPANFQFKKTKPKDPNKEPEWYFVLINPNEEPKSEAYIIARRIATFKSKENALKASKAVLNFIKTLKGNEGMYLIEHILLRPNVELATAKTETFLPICADACEAEACEPLDPYSFRVSIVLPGWTERFSNIDFRRFVEDLIRRELPAHIVAKICWIGYPKNYTDEDGKPIDENEMVILEEAYKTWLLSRTTSEQAQDETALLNLNKAISSLHTIYHQGRLHRCRPKTQQEPPKTGEPKENTTNRNVILGRTNLGKI